MMDQESSTPALPSRPHDGGGSDEKENSVEGGDSAPKIQCGRCMRFRGRQHFSNRQMANAARRGGIANGRVKCRLCTGLQVVELTCIICGDTKALKGFSKAQRKDPDNARCLACVDIHLTTEPGLDPPVDLEELLEETEDLEEFDAGTEGLSIYDDPEDQLKDTAASLTVDKLTISQPTDDENLKPSAHVLSEENVGLLDRSYAMAAEASPTPEGTDLEYGGWITQPRHGREEVGASFTAYDAQGVAQSRASGPPSTVVNYAPQASRAPNGMGQAKPTAGKSSNFARSKPVRGPAFGGIYSDAAKYGQSKAKRVLPEIELEDDEDDDYMKSW